MRIAAHLLIRILLRLLFAFHAPTQLEHRQCIVIANHNSHIDVMALFALFPLSMIPKVRCLVAGDYFSRGLKHWLSRYLFNAIAVDRRAGFTRVKPTEPGKQALGQGQSLILFPEGTRGEPGRMADFKAGIGELVLEFPDLPIILVALRGIEKALPRNETLVVPFSVTAIVLPPVTGRALVEEQNVRTRKEVAAELEARLRAALDASEPPRAARPK